MATEYVPVDEEEIVFEKNLGVIDDALAQARRQLGAMTDAASSADKISQENGEYSLHEVPSLGRYAVVRKTGWRALLKVIHDPAANIDFSANEYPSFDGAIGQIFKSPYLLDPLDDRYESYKNLRDNIAAVRNFLMESYYVDTPPGMTPEKAKQAMDEIAKYIGKGLDNNYRFLGLIPNHKTGQPWISIDEASAPGGAGAQYLYEKILEMHRQSSWMRPFAAVVTLFGGHAPPDWKLPPAHETEFTDMFARDIAPEITAAGPKPEDLKKGIGSVEELEAARTRLVDQHQMTHLATDLNMLGDQLIHSAGNMQHVAHLSEPVRRDAIEIAKDILRKLRGNLGNVEIQNGLNLPPTDDASALGAVKGVAMIYERMLGWARGIDATIMQHPSVIAGVQAIGQMGYLAKTEALRMAKIAGNSKLADEIAGQLEKLPAAYSSLSDTKFAGLLDKIESGINVLMNRVQTISGPSAQIGNSSSKDGAQSINQAPTAGLGQQTNSIGHTSDDAAKRNAQLLAAENAFQQSQAARLQQQNARRESPNARRESVNQNQSQRPNGRQIFQTRTTTQQRQIVTTRTIQPAIQRPNQPPSNAAYLAHLQHEHEEHEHQIKQRVETQRQLTVQQRQAAKIAAQKIDPGMLKSFRNATNTRGMGPIVSPKKTVSPAMPPVPTETYNTRKPAGANPNSPDNKNLVNTLPPNKGGRGF